MKEGLIRCNKSAVRRWVGYEVFRVLVRPFTGSSNLQVSNLSRSSSNQPHTAQYRQSLTLSSPLTCIRIMGRFKTELPLSMAFRRNHDKGKYRLALT